MKTTKLITGLIAAAALLSGSSIAFAQSTVLGTLTGGGSGTTSLTGTVTGSTSTLTGTVTGGSSSTGGGGGGGGGGGSNVVDICPNLSGVQSTLPSGYVMQNGTCVLSSGSTGGTGGTGGGSVAG